MASVTLNLRNLSVSEKVSLARRVLTGMDGNAHFPAPDPPLVLLSRLANELDGQDESPLLAKNELLLDDTLTRLATYVQKTSGGSQLVIQSAGMEADSPGAGNGTLPKPQNLRVARSKIESEMTVSCDPVPGARTYVFQSTADPLTAESQWNIGSVSTGHIGTITRVTPGQLTWFRVSAVGPAGQGPWSDPASGQCD